MTFQLLLVDMVSIDLCFEPITVTRVIYHRYRIKIKKDQARSGSMPETSEMKCVRRESVAKKFEVTSSTPVPEVPHGGARIKVSAPLIGV